MALDRILLVDDEPNVLSGYRRSLRGQFDLTTAISGQEALEKIASDPPFAVVVSDMRMPEMNGVELLKRIKVANPDSVRMMLTGNADQETAIQAVNQGHIFRFLNKPCQPQTLSIALAMGVRQFKLITAEKELLEKTLKGSIDMLTQILSLTDPDAFTTVNKVKSYLSLVSEEMNVPNPWVLEVAVLLSPIGFLTLPPELKVKVSREQPLSQKEEQAVASVPEIGGRLLSNIPRLEDVSELLRCGVDKPRADYTASKLSQETTFGLALLRLLHDLVQLERGGLGIERSIEALKETGKHETTLVDRIQNALQHVQPTLFSGEYTVMDLSLKKMVIGDELFENVISEDNRLLLARGTRMTRPFLERLDNYRKLVGIKEPIKIKRFVPVNSNNPSPPVNQ